MLQNWALFQQGLRRNNFINITNYAISHWNGFLGSTPKTSAQDYEVHLAHISLPPQISPTSSVGSGMNIYLTYISYDILSYLVCLTSIRVLVLHESGFQVPSMQEVPTAWGGLPHARWSFLFQKIPSQLSLKSPGSQRYHKFSLKPCLQDTPKLYRRCRQC